MMQKLTTNRLMPLEEYARQRDTFRVKVMEHKKNRQVQIGPNARLYFEDELTMQYQVQEMLRAERIFEPAGIEEELASYNPLIPDGTNWKATFMLEYPDVEERREVLTQLKGIERSVWVKVADHQPVYAIADEDLEREDEQKTSAVHFLRFELTPEMRSAAISGAPTAMGVDHSVYSQSVNPVDPAVSKSLAQDLAA
jgi:hypothetical protein